MRNILTSFDDFGDDDVISEAEFQDYRSVYVDLYAEMRRAADVEKEVVNDDLVFEIELVKQVEVGVDYVLMLVEKHREEAGAWELLAATSRLITDLGQPILVGSSRKRFLAQAAEAEAIPVQRDAVTVATTALAAASGAWAVRVHEVPANRAAVRTASLWKEHQ